MEFTGHYVRTLWRDEKTGETIFAMFTKAPDVSKTEYNNVICRGVIPLYPKDMPLRVSGEEQQDRQGNPIFLVSSCVESSFDKDKAADFLASRVFKGIGPKTAERIIETVGGDLFAFAERDDAVEVLEGIKGVRPETAASTVEAIREYRSMRELIAFLMHYGGTYQNALHLHNLYGNDAIRRLKETPYAMVRQGLSYCVCEAIAKEQNTRSFADDRLAALLAECFERSEAEGNTCLDIKKIQKEKERIEKDSNMNYQTDMFFLGAALLKNKSEYIPSTIDGVPTFYSRQMYDLEKSAVTAIQTLQKAPGEIEITDEAVQKTEETLGIRYSEKQREAFGLLRFAGVSILTGGPGTGKTTVLNGLMRCYKELAPDMQILLCAPTANAAKRMRESTGMKAVTVHKLLGLIPNENEETLITNRDLECGLLVVDEASMLDIELLSCIVKSVKPGTRILLVGDEDQLESVGPGNVLHDLLDSGKIPFCRLDVVYRQSSGSNILENSIRIREGETNLVKDTDFKIITVPADDDIRDTALKVYAKMRNGASPWSCRLLTPVRKVKYQYGTYWLNQELQERYNAGSTGLVYGNKEFRIGDPVVFLRNNYEAGYINGDEGIVKEYTDSKEGKGLLIRMEDKEIQIEGQMLDDVDLSYATTVHKSQGGECDTCIVVVPSAPQGMLKRAMLYVAVTRAKKQVIIIQTEGAVQRAIQNTGHTKRITGLKKMLAGKN